MDAVKTNPLKYAKICLIVYFLLNILGGILYITGLDREIMWPLFVIYITDVLPVILLAIYLFCFAEKTKHHPLLIIYCCVSVVFHIFNLADEFSWIVDYGMDILAFIYLAFAIAEIVITIMCVVDIANKHTYIQKTRKYLLYFCVASIIKIFTSVFSNIVYGIFSWSETGSIIKSISTIALYLIFLILWLFILKGQPTKESLEDSLINIKNQLDNGIITEEEYNQRKADILNQL